MRWCRLELHLDRIDTEVRGGLLDYGDILYTNDDESNYVIHMGDAYQHSKQGTPRTGSQKSTYYRQWRTHQMPDHYPL